MDRKERAKEIRAELRELRQDQKAYRESKGFRVLGGLGDRSGFKMARLKRELRELGYKR